LAMVLVVPVTHLLSFYVLHVVLGCGVSVCGRGRHHSSFDTPGGYSINSTNCPIM
jgi:hypothetical protein